ncbi:hypothetical protein [Saccharothrix lopnurensis]|uniref:Uncharacterized protein n=1 Tax=Saccharothrix lopnurensis TaxID=1670621 RepID=A0ABW1P700_9PSEU
MIFCELPGCTNPEPVPGNSRVCDLCREKLHERLRWVEYFAAHLTPVRGTRPQLVATASGFESASPADDHVLAMLDRRSSAVGVGRTHTGPEDAEHPPLSVPAVLGGWAQQVWEARTPESLRHLIGPPQTVRDAVSLLLTSLGWIGEQDWADDFAEEVGDLYRQLAAATGEAPPKPVATCTHRDGPPPAEGDVDERPECGAGVVVRERTDDESRGPRPVGARCLAGHSYTGFQLLKLVKEAR